MRLGKPRITYQLTTASVYFHYAFRFNDPMTRAHVRLLGPCFKTGRMGNRQDTKAERRSVDHQTPTPMSQARRNGIPATSAPMPAVPSQNRSTRSITIAATALDTQVRHSTAGRQRATNSRPTRHHHCLWCDLREMHLEGQKQRYIPATIRSEMQRVLHQPS